MNDALLFEAGVHYRFPISNRYEECPKDMKEFKYERFRYGISYGIERVFIMELRPTDFLSLLQNWNKKGNGWGYLYISVDTN